MAILRPARDRDHDLYLRLFPELGVDDPPADADRWVDELLPDARVLEEDGSELGYVIVQILERVGYVRQIVVDPAARGRGVGSQAMAGIAALFRDAGCRTWCLNVKPDNEAAVRLYRRCGMVERYRTTSLRWRWSWLDELLEEATNGPRTDELGDVRQVRCTPADPSELPRVEERFAMPSGLLAAFEAKERIVVIVARRQNEIVGVASFDPVFPGCFPFRADDLTVALALLAAARPHAAPDAEYLQLVVEDAGHLVVALERLGAIRMLELAHYRGELAHPPGDGVPRGSS